MVVVAIMGIVMTIAIPSMYRTLHPDSMQRAIEDFTEACRTARASAILQGTPVEVVFRAEDGEISVQGARGDRAGGIEVEQRRNQGVDYVAFRRQGGSGSPGGVGRPTSGGGSGVGGYTSRHMSKNIAVEDGEVNFTPIMELDEAPVRFYANGPCDEFKMVLFRPDTGERRLITLEVVTGLRTWKATH
jgi:hypothetical protein